MGKGSRVVVSFNGSGVNKWKWVVDFQKITNGSWGRGCNYLMDSMYLMAGPYEIFLARMYLTTGGALVEINKVNTPIKHNCENILGW